MNSTGNYSPKTKVTDCKKEALSGNESKTGDSGINLNNSNNGKEQSVHNYFINEAECPEYENALRIKG